VTADAQRIAQFNGESRQLRRGTSSNTVALLRRAACVLLQTYGQWHYAGRRDLAEACTALFTSPARARSTRLSGAVQEVIDTDVLRAG